MADSFKKARELARLKRTTENGGQEEKERGLLLPSSSSPSSSFSSTLSPPSSSYSSSSLAKRGVEGGENDESFVRATIKRPYEDATAEESGLRPPSKRVYAEEAGEERAFPRWELAKLQASLKQLQEQSERYRLDAESQRALVVSQEANHAKKISLLESQIRTHNSSTITKQTPPKADQSLLQEIRAELLEKKRQLSASQQEIEELRTSEHTWKHQYESIKEANSMLESTHRASQQKMDEFINKINTEKNERNNEQKQLLEDALRKIKDLEQQLIQSKKETPEKLLLNNSNNNINNTNNTHEMSLLLREKEREIRQLQAENQRMRAKVKTCETAEDELAELRSKEGRNEKMREEFAQIQSELLTLKEREEDWISTLYQFFPSSSSSSSPSSPSSLSITTTTTIAVYEEEGGKRGGGPRDILRVIENLQHTCQLQKAEQGQIMTLNKQLELRLSQQQEKSASFETKLREAETALEQAQTAVEKGRVELSRALKDKEMYKKFLDSYEAEEKTVKHDDARGVRIEELENSLSVAQARANEKETAVHVLELQNRQLEQHLQQVEAEAAKMSEALGRGEFNPQNTKVLHMSMNPAKKATEAKTHAQLDQLTKQRDELQLENEHLKLKLVEGEKGAIGKNALVLHQSRDMTDLAEKEKEIVKLKKTISDLEITKERFYQVFKEKVKEFRESCYMLTGFKIDMKQNDNRNGFVLRSMYAEKEEDTLEFYDTGTKLEVMETHYCKTLDKHILQYLEKFNSIPAFLSEVTLDLFNKQTRVV